ncbi:glutaredoxin family protein [Massilia endophytica]|uniref:glutaredoxin family protein n=1 Tax=Massilia endophytica TaxID=2899220 RepID=UPI001E4BCF75|nr:glutaredoxin family protein [Massilia endophytica]UGQ45342.1 glutaredoxin family protein [Massilia endophytica]
MKKLAAVLLACLVLPAQAQMYKWKDARGVTHYTDTPPPAARAEVKNFATGAPVSLPYELAEPARARPVTLYTTADCAACAEARNMLRARGIPFAEKTVATNEDYAALKRAGSNGQLPLLLVGRSKQIGFEQVAWDTMLTDAGYPLTRVLPQGYQWPSPTPAAPPRQPTEEEKAVAAAKVAAEEQARLKRKPPVNAPPDFQF